MPSVEEILRSLRGAAVLFLARPDGLSALDRSVGGFWRSFAAIILIVPLNAITMLALAQGSQERFGGLFVSQLPVLAADWVAFPIALAIAARPLGVGAHYVSYVVARNWAAPIAAAILTVPFLLEGAGWIPRQGSAFLSLVALVIVLRYHYVILRLALQATVPIALALVMVDVLLTLVISTLIG